VRVARATWLAAVLACVTFALEASAFAADDKQQCLAASEKAQQLKNAGKLSEAREQLAICSREVCPKLIQSDCTNWTSEIIANLMPSVVPAAKDKKGHDLVDVKLSVDGRVVTETLDGKPIAVDPGVHTFRYEAKGLAPVEEKLVVRQGEKNRIMTVTIGGDEDGGKGTGAVTAGGATNGGGTSNPNENKNPEPDRKGGEPHGRPFPIVPVVVGALGLVAGGVALYIDLDANADARKLRDSCAPKCDPSEVDDIEQRRVIAAVTAAAGGALLITGVVLYFVLGGSDTRTGSRAPVFAAAPIPGGAAGTAMVRF